LQMLISISALPRPPRKPRCRRKFLRWKAELYHHDTHCNVQAQAYHNETQNVILFVDRDEVIDIPVRIRQTKYTPTRSIWADAIPGIYFGKNIRYNSGVRIMSVPIKNGTTSPGLGRQKYILIEPVAVRIFADLFVDFWI